MGLGQTPVNFRQPDGRTEKGFRPTRPAEKMRKKNLQVLIDLIFHRGFFRTLKSFFLAEKTLHKPEKTFAE